MQKPAGTYILLAFLPLSAVFLFLFCGGLLSALLQSFGFMPAVPYEGGWFDAYIALFSHRYLHSWLHSLLIALLSAGPAVVVGVLAAYFIWKLPQSLRNRCIVYKIPLILPHIAVGFIVVIFWTESGFISSLLYHIGIIKESSEFASPLFNGTGLGMVQAFVYKEIPFVILMAYAVLTRLDKRRIQTAQMLGASNIRIFFSIVVPHTAPVLHTTFIILFLYNFGAFEIPYILGESSPNMLGIEAYQLYFMRNLSNRPAASAILVMMFLFSILFIVLYAKIGKRLQSKERKV